MKINGATQIQPGSLTFGALHKDVLDRINAPSTAPTSQPVTTNSVLQALPLYRTATGADFAAGTAPRSLIVFVNGLLCTEYTTSKNTSTNLYQITVPSAQPSDLIAAYTIVESTLSELLWPETAPNQTEPPAEVPTQDMSYIPNDPAPGTYGPFPGMDNGGGQQFSVSQDRSITLSYTQQGANLYGFDISVQNQNGQLVAMNSGVSPSVTFIAAADTIYTLGTYFPSGNPDSYTITVS